VGGGLSIRERIAHGGPETGSGQDGRIGRNIRRANKGTSDLFGPVDQNENRFAE